MNGTVFNIGVTTCGFTMATIVEYHPQMSLEAELLEENPEFAQIIHSLNMQEIQSNQRGVQNVLGSGRLVTKKQSAWSKLFPLLGR
jgi:hypothetical protein